MKENEKLPFLPPQRIDEFERESFDAMMKAGTVTSAAELMFIRGFKSPRTGHPYTRMAVYNASIRYMVKNHAEVKDKLFELWKVQGRIENVSDDEWEAFIVEKAMKYLAGKYAFVKWLEENPWAEKYDYIYAKRFGIRQTSFGNF